MRELGMSIQLDAIPQKGELFYSVENGIQALKN